MGKWPTELLIGRKIKTKIPTKIVVPVGQDHIEARRKERTCREKQKIKEKSAGVEYFSRRQGSDKKEVNI